MITYNFYYILFFLIMFEILGGYLFKKVNKNQNYLYYGIISYSIVGYLFYLFIKETEKLSIGNIYWQVGNILLVTMFSVLFLKEKLTQKQILGIIIIVGGIYLIN